VTNSLHRLAIEATVSKRSIIKNRRFKKLQELIEQGEYFSEEQIKKRDPLMYHMYVGRFQRNADVKGDALIMSDFIF
jgi:hypothetical protein